MPERLVDAVIAAGPNGTVDLASVMPEGTDTFAVFPGYRTDDEVRAVVGDVWPAGDGEPVPYDGRSLLVWLVDDELGGWGVLNAADRPGAVRFESCCKLRPISDATFGIYRGNHRRFTPSTTWPDRSPRRLRRSSLSAQVTSPNALR